MAFDIKKELNRAIAELTEIYGSEKTTPKFWKEDKFASIVLEQRLSFQSISQALPGILTSINTQTQVYDYMNKDKYWTGHTLAEWNELGENQRRKWIHPEDIDSYLSLTNKWQKTARSESLELRYRIRTRRGRFLWLKSLTVCVFSINADCSSIVEYSEDISDEIETELKLEMAKNELSRSKQRHKEELEKLNQRIEQDTVQYVRGSQELRLNLENFRNLIKNSIDGIIVAAMDNRIVLANRRATAMTGYDNATLLQSRLEDLFPPIELEKVLSVVEKRVDERIGNRQFETEIIDSLGHNLVMELTAVRTTWQGEPSNVFTIRDVKERRLSEGKRISIHVRNAVEQRYTFEGIVSKNPTVLKNFEILPTIANSDSSLLVTGESGTGKDLIVRAIHNLSPRKDSPLVTVNSAALPDTLIESELFGYMKGAFTDAKEDKPGRFVQANGGTLFLDEIGDISPAMQVRLLRVLQEKVVEPLGGKESVKVDVRVIAATHRNLEQMVEEGSFRRDLYYRINVVQFHMPPLRERTEDIPVLVEHFLGKFNKLFGKDITSVSPQAMSLLMNYEFPGNVRELENFIEHAFLLCRGEKIMPENLPESTRKSQALLNNLPWQQPILEHEQNHADMSAPEAAAPQDFSYSNNPESTSETKGKAASGSIQEFESDLIMKCLEKHKWNRSAAAEELGIHRVTLNRKIKKLKLVLPTIDGRTSYRNIS